MGVFFDHTVRQKHKNILTEQSEGLHLAKVTELFRIERLLKETIAEKALFI